MAKNNLLPETIEKQFNKALFNPGEPVCITWLGTKKYGYVQNHKKTNWGVQYTVEAESRRYPCGIRIKEWSTAYTTGCILYDITREIGSDELTKRIRNNTKPRFTRDIPTDTGSTTVEISSDDSSSGGNDATPNVAKRKDTTKGNGVEDDVHVSTPRVQQRNTKKRKDVKLDDAIQRQRDFLNGFVKRD
jgi:hypothetical protein